MFLPILTVGALAQVQELVLKQVRDLARVHLWALTVVRQRVQTSALAQVQMVVRMQVQALVRVH